MRMSRKLIIITLIVSMFICLFNVNPVYALSFTTTITTDTTTVPESKEFTVKVKVSNLDVGENGINQFNGYLEYDANLFETITEASIEGLNGWVASYTPDNKRIQLLNTSFVKNDSEVFQITFKTKTDILGKEGKIELKRITASNSETEINATDISTKITIGNVTAPVDPLANTTPNTTQNSLNIDINTTPNTNIANTNTNTENTNILPQNNMVGGNNTVQEIPHTGAEDTLVQVLFVVALITIISYIRYYRLRDVR